MRNYNEEFARRVLGDEAYDNAPCQASDLELVEHHIRKLQAVVDAAQHLEDDGYTLSGSLGEALDEL